MPCTGSSKSADSTMLSCLSPRRPCCGPKAAVSWTSPQRRERIEGMRQLRVTEAGCASSARARPERLAQGRLGEQAVDAEFHGALTSLLGSSSSAKLSGWWKSGLPGGCASAQ